MGSAGDNYPILNSQTPRQFASTARLFSAAGFNALRQAHVGVIGIGGVGSWAAEALARSGVGALTLVDMDHVAESNLNRQVQALHSTLGMAKGQALKARLQDISPDCAITLLDDFLTPENAAEILGSAEVKQQTQPQTQLQVQPQTGQPAAQPGFWIDATDDLRAKKAIITTLAQMKRLSALVVSGGAGGKTDPTRIETADLSESSQDPLLSSLRYDLRKHHGFSRDQKMKIMVVYSRQQMINLEDCDPAAKLACAGYGSLVTVTATMGMVAAGAVINKILKG
jgi:tRNA threonylcarbamoyladenosine dehydratase